MSIKVTTAENKKLPGELDRELSTVAKGAGISFSGKITGTGIKYLTQVIIARFLGTELFGLYALGIVLYQVGETLARMGLQSGTVRYASIHNSTKDLPRLKGVLQQAIGIPFCGGSIIGIVFFLASRPIAEGIFAEPNLTPVLRIFAIAIPLGASMNVSAFATTCFQTTKYMVFVTGILHPISNLLLVVLLCVLGMGLQGAVAAWVIASVFGLSVSVYFVKKIFPEGLWKGLKSVAETAKLLKFSLPLAFGGFLGFILLWMSTLMLGYFKSAYEVGIFRAASQTALLLIIILNSLNTIFSPMIADLFHKDDQNKMEQIFKLTTRWSFSATIPLFIIICLSGQDILHIFGQEFIAGWLPLVFLAGGQLVNAGTGGIAYILIMSGHQYQKLFGDVLLVILNILLNIFFIPRWGLVGAAVATSISMGSVNILRVLQVYAMLKIHAYNRVYLKPIGSGILAGFLGFGLQSWLPAMHFILALMIMATFILITYTLSLWVMGLEKNDKMILNKINKKIKKIGEYRQSDCP
jgi:O-antigen/teichoic acid export membrane protein